MIERKTYCAHCVFRTNDSTGQQTGCSLGRIEKFIARNEAYKENDYYVIKRFCETCRSQPTTKEQVLKQIELSYKIIIDGRGNYFERLKEILKFQLKPRQVFVVISSKFDFEKYKEFQELYKNKEIALIFKRYFDNKTFPTMVDEVIAKFKTKYYIPVKDNIKYENIEKMDKLVNYDLETINAIIEPEYYNSVIQCHLHKFLGGNIKHSISRKIEELLKLEENQGLEKNIIFNE